MVKNKFFVIAICTSMLLSFSYGVVTAQYEIFPYELMKAIKQIANPSPG
jgi:hypothetical protein